MSRSLIVLPDDSAPPILDADGCYETGSLGAGHAEPGPSKRRVGERTDAKDAEVAGVDVLDSSPHFDLTHEKSMVVDDATAFVMSFNWEPRNLTETRDYAVVTSAHHEVAEMIECFVADWSRKSFTPGEKSHLIWCIENGRQRIGQFIDDAQHTLWLQNERYQDPPSSSI
jgi:hypothetical protein